MQIQDGVVRLSKRNNPRYSRSLLNRRSLLKTAGVGIVSASLGSQTVVADDEDTEPSISFADQQSDGTTVVIEEVTSNVDASVVIEGSTAVGIFGIQPIASKFQPVRP